MTLAARTMTLLREKIRRLLVHVLYRRMGVGGWSVIRDPGRTDLE